MCERTLTELLRAIPFAGKDSCCHECCIEVSDTEYCSTICGVICICVNKALRQLLLGDKQ